MNLSFAAQGKQRSKMIELLGPLLLTLSGYFRSHAKDLTPRRKDAKE
jgi:hypothetical protein